MVTIFTTCEGAVTIYADPIWQRIIKKIVENKKTKIIIDSEIPNDEDSELYLLDTTGYFRVQKDYIESVKKNHANVLNEPCGIFLLDITREEANEIQTKYGVICQSLDYLDHTILTQKGTHAELHSSGKDKKWSWELIFRKFQRFPTNAVLVIDAHLFNNDKWNDEKDEYSDTQNLGLSNLQTILDQILPEQFEGTYHIGVLLTDYEVAAAKRQTRTNLKNQQIANKINKIKKKIDRPYKDKINIEVIFMNQETGYHQLIHNRRILTNTYVLNADYKLAAFDANGKSRTTQTVKISPLFEFVDVDDDGDGDVKAKALNNDLDDFSEYIGNQKNKDPQKNSDKGYINGKQESFSTILHRFLSKDTSKINEWPKTENKAR